MKQLDIAAEQATIRRSGAIGPVLQPHDTSSALDAAPSAAGTATALRVPPPSLLAASLFGGSDLSGLGCSRR